MQILKVIDAESHYVSFFFFFFFLGGGGGGGGDNLYSKFIS